MENIEDKAKEIDYLDNIKYAKISNIVTGISATTALIGSFSGNYGLTAMALIGTGLTVIAGHSLEKKIINYKSKE
jgi:hypothetical protein